MRIRLRMHEEEHMDITGLKTALGDDLFTKVSEKVKNLEGMYLVDDKSGDWIPKSRYDEELKGLRDTEATLEEMRGKLEEADNRLLETGKKHLGQLDKLKGSLRERDEKLQSLSGEMEQLQHSVDALTGDIKQKDGVIASLNRQVAEKDASIQGLKREQKVRTMVSQSGAREQDVVFKLLDMDQIHQEEDGSLSGVTEQLDALKKNSSYLFGHSFSPKGGFEGGRENPRKPGAGAKDVNAAIRAAFGH